MLDNLRAYLMRDRTVDEINLIARPKLVVPEDLAAIRTVHFRGNGILVNLEVPPALSAVALAA